MFTPPSLTLPDITAHYPLVLFYKGNYSDNPTFSIVDIVEKNLSLYLEKRLIRKLAYMVIEAVQNIERYSKGHASSGDFCLVFSDRHTFHVITQNRIANSDIQALKDRLDLVNSRHIEELNRLYKETLDSGERTEKGAGLGLIDMVRKSENNLGYAFFREDEQHSLYRLHIRIPLSEDKVTQDPLLNDHLTRLLTGHFSEARSALFYTGDFSNSFLQALLYMVRTLKQSGNAMADSIFQYTLIELTQNIKRHGQKVDDKIPAYLSLEWKAGSVNVACFNLVSDAQLPPLLDKLELLQKASLEEIKQLSEKSLTDFKLKGGLGLIDLTLRNNPNRIVHHLSKVHTFGTGISLSLEVAHG
jgi:hypothetical protein